MVSIFLKRGVSIRALVRQSERQECCYQCAFLKPYNGNCQQLHFFPQLIQNVDQNVLCDGDRLFKISWSVLQSFGQSKKPLRWWLRTFHTPQSCWMHRAPHATPCVQGTCVVFSSRGIQRSWGTYLRKGSITRLGVKWTGTSVKICHSYDDVNGSNSYSGCLALQLPICLGVQTRLILQTIRE